MACRESASVLVSIPLISALLASLLAVSVTTCSPSKVALTSVPVKLSKSVLAFIDAISAISAINILFRQTTSTPPPSILWMFTRTPQTTLTEQTTLAQFPLSAFLAVKLFKCRTTRGPTLTPVYMLELWFSMKPMVLLLLG